MPSKTISLLMFLSRWMASTIRRISFGFITPSPSPPGEAGGFELSVQQRHASCAAARQGAIGPHAVARSQLSLAKLFKLFPIFPGLQCFQDFRRFLNGLFATAPMSYAN